MKRGEPPKWSYCKEGGTFGGCLLPSNASITSTHSPSLSPPPPSLSSSVLLTRLLRILQHPCLRGKAFPVHAAAFDLVHFKCDFGGEIELLRGLTAVRLNARTVLTENKSSNGGVLLLCISFFSVAHDAPSLFGDSKNPQRDVSLTSHTLRQ